MLKPTGIRLEDLKTGQSNLNIQAARKKKALSEDQEKELRAKRKEIPHPLSIDEWHQVYITVSGDKISCTIDGMEVGSLRSPGIAHETKTFVRLQIHKSICIDDVRFWRKSRGSE